MKEQDYILVRDLSNLMVISRCLGDLNPGHSVMQKDEVADIARAIQKWTDAIYKKINMQ